MQNTNLNNLFKVLTVLGLALFLVSIIYAFNLYREGKLIGANASNVISVSGKGEMDVKPDMASITLTLREAGKDQKEGEVKVAKKANDFLVKIKSLIEEKDIKTDNYNSYPKYSYQTPTPYATPYSSPKIDGYEVSQSISIKVRDTKNVGKIIEMISSSGINEVSGPNYEIDDIEKYKDTTRAIAIKDAKEKAEKLAKDLGVDLGRIVSFSEGNDYSYPTYMKSANVQSFANDAVSPSLPAGENKVKSDVTITFEIK